MILLRTPQVPDRVIWLHYSFTSYMVAEEPWLEEKLLFLSRHCWDPAFGTCSKSRTAMGEERGVVL